MESHSGYGHPLQEKLISKLEMFAQRFEGKKFHGGSNPDHVDM